MQNIKNIIIKLQQEKPNIYNYLIEDIETYLISLNYNTRNWKYSNLNLNIQEVVALKEYLKHEKKPKPNQEEKIITSITQYISKIEFKENLIKNENSIEELGLSSYIINRLKNENINYIYELIELIDSLDNINKIGPKSKKTILESLKKIMILNITQTIKHK